METNDKKDADAKAFALKMAEIEDALYAEGWDGTISVGGRASELGLYKKPNTVTLDRDKIPPLAFFQDLADGLRKDGSGGWSIVMQEFHDYLKKIIEQDTQTETSR